MPFEKWRTKNGSLVHIDSYALNNRLKIGSVYAKFPEVAARCIWDATNGQCWGKDCWDLSEEIKEETENAIASGGANKVK